VDLDAGRLEGLDEPLVLPAGLVGRHVDVEEVRPRIDAAAPQLQPGCVYPDPVQRFVLGTDGVLVHPCRRLDRVDP